MPINWQNYVPQIIETGTDIINDRRRSGAEADAANAVNQGNQQAIDFLRESRDMEYARNEHSYQSSAAALDQMMKMVGLTPVARNPYQQQPQNPTSGGISLPGRDAPMPIGNTPTPSRGGSGGPVLPSTGSMSGGATPSGAVGAAMGSGTGVTPGSGSRINISDNQGVVRGTPTVSGGDLDRSGALRRAIGTGVGAITGIGALGGLIGSSGGISGFDSMDMGQLEGLRPIIFNMFQNAGIDPNSEEGVAILQQVAGQAGSPGELAQMIQDIIAQYRSVGGGNWIAPDGTPVQGTPGFNRIAPTDENGYYDLSNLFGAYGAHSSKNRNNLIMLAEAGKEDVYKNGKFTTLHRPQYKKDMGDAYVHARNPVTRVTDSNYAPADRRTRGNMLKLAMQGSGPVYMAAGGHTQSPTMQVPNKDLPLIGQTATSSYPGASNNNVVANNPGGTISTPADYDITVDPSYQFRKDEGMRALETSAAAKGGLLSGGFARSALRYAQDYASTEYSNIYNRLATIANKAQTVGNASSYNQSIASLIADQGANYGDAIRHSAGYDSGADIGQILSDLPWKDLLR